VIPGSSTDRLKAEAEEAIAQGELPKARGLLRTATDQSHYDPDLYEMYGRVLLHTGKRQEAGKWLFLSSRRSVAYEDAINQFLASRGRHGGLKLYQSFPAAARLGGPDNYPQPLCDELKALGVPDSVKPGSVSMTFAQESRTAVVFTQVGCGCALLFLLTSVVVGAVTIFKWLGNQVGGWFQ
jgi:hypothetical protein